MAYSTATAWRQIVYGAPRVASPGDHVFAVGELAAYVAAKFENDLALQDVWLRGEIGSLSRPGSGHYYFCLKDDESQIRCVFFRGSAQRAAVAPTAGAAVVAHGRMEFYSNQGTSQLVVDQVFPEGMGLAQMQLEALARRLEAEGLFDPKRKRPLPAFPRRIGVATSETGAVIHDLLTVLGRRYPICEVVVADTPVQGDGAVPRIVRALRLLNEWRGPDGQGLDLLVLARGGGSAEDLACFNEESLIRAVFASRVPVVSAIGHESDTTLCDLAADLRAPTPSAAAEQVAPDLAEVRREVRRLRAYAASLVVRGISSRGEVSRLARQRMREALTRRLLGAREQVATRRLHLEALSPRATLARGYAIAEHRGRVLADAATVSPGDEVRIQLQVGSIETLVRQTRDGT